MYCALFETAETTADEQFFSDLMKVFCSNYVQNIIDLYPSVRQGYGGLDRDSMEKHLKSKKEGYDVFNCRQHLMTTDCPNVECRANHTIILASDQHDKFSQLMQAAKTTPCRIDFDNHDDKKMKWIAIQTIFQRHNMVKFFRLEVLNFEESDDHDVYLDRYVKEANKKSSVKGCTYVRATSENAGSDYDKFVSKTKLKNVVPCDILKVHLHSA